MSESTLVVHVVDLCMKSMFPWLLCFVILLVMKSQANITREAAGWSVRIVRDGEQHSKYFRFTEGGIRASLARAKKWRDKKLREVGERQWKKGPRKRATNNTSGTVGVSKNVYGRWVATWQQEGVQRFKTFKLKREAVAHREKMLKLTLSE